MKKNVVSIIVAVVLVLSVIAAVVVNYNINNNKEAEKYYKTIEEKIIAENKKDLKEYKTFYSIDKYGVKKEENKVYLYAYVFVENYYRKDDGKVTIDSGYAIPHRFEFENGEYKEAKIPLDGSYYESSLSEMYPLTIRMKMDFSNSNEKMKENIKKQVEEFYSISYDEIVY